MSPIILKFNKMESIDDARNFYPETISITEVKLNR